MSYQQYRDDPGLNQSYLKQVLDNNIRRITPTKKMLDGTGIDCLLYTPDEFTQRYLVFNDVPTGALKEEIEKYVIEKDRFDAYDILQQLRIREYQNNWTDPTMMKNVQKYEDYAQSIIDGVTPISSKDYFRYSEAVSAIKNSEIWKDVFRVTNEYQKDLYCDYIIDEDTKVRCKGLLDDLWIDSGRNKAIVTDCKFTSAKNMDEFFSIARSFKYPLQMAFYKMLVEQNYKSIDVTCQWLVYFSYTKQVKLIKVHPFDLEVGKSGAKCIKEEWYNHNVTHMNEIDVKGYEDAIHIWHQANYLGLDDFDIESYYNKNIYLNQSIYF